MIPRNDLNEIITDMTSTKEEFLHRQSSYINQSDWRNISEYIVQYSSTERHSLSMASRFPKIPILQIHKYNVIRTLPLVVSLAAAQQLVGGGAAGAAVVTLVPF